MVSSLPISPETGSIANGQRGGRSIRSMSAPVLALAAFVLAFPDSLSAGMRQHGDVNTMKHLPYVLAPLSLLIASAGLAENDTRKLEDVVVTASRSAQTVGINNAYVQIIGTQEIKDSGAQTVSDVLRRAADIQVVDSIGDGSAPIIGMRGFGSNGSQNVLILLDGRRFNNDTDIGSSNLRNISLQDIERIEIVNGSSGTLYGAGAVGGVINIITKRSSGTQLDVSVTRGSYDTEKYKARTSTRHGAWGITLTGDKELSDNYRDRNALNHSYGQARLDYLTRTIEGYLELSKLKQSVQYSGSLDAAQLQANRRQAQNPGDGSEIDGTRISTGGSLALGQNWRASVDASRRKDDLQSVITIGGFTSALTQQREQTIVSPRLEGKIPLAGTVTTVIIGHDAERGDYHLQSTMGPMQAKPTTNSQYIQVSVPTGSSLEWVGGYRHARHKSNISDGFTYPAGERIKDSVNAGSLGVFWSPAERLKTWLRADQNFRFGMIDEHTQVSFMNPVPLKTQTGTSYELGLEQSWKQQSIRLQAYQLDLDNEISYDATNFANINLDPTRRQGISAQWNMQATSKVDLALQTALVNGKFTSGPNDGKYIPLVPKHTATAALTYRPLESTTLALESQYTGSRHADSDYDNTVRVKPVTVTNLSASQQWRALTLSVRINNLFDKQYNAYTTETWAGVGYYPAAERNLLFTAAYKLK